ncbi:LysR family transcriptional regulator [Photobacterium kagoshimensis]|uniref:LysR family transcriptional regulator n=1 Tax=Photobacterium kagoshimensis TaxID=2910242 RepID=UPI003D09D3F6
MKKIDDIDIRLLQLFLIIVESDGFSAAQYQLNMHQSSISKKMNDLETRLGMTLCHRGRSGFKLTPDGLKVYEMSRQLFGQIDVFQKQIDNIRSVSCGNIQFGMVDNLVTNPDCLISAAIASFVDKHPQVRIDCAIADSYQIEKGLLEDKFDIGITSSEVKKSGLDYHYLFEEKQSLYCVPQHAILGIQRPASLEDIQNNALVERGLAHHITPMSEVMAACCTAYAPNMEATAHLILSGRFMGYLPDHYADIWLQKGMMVKVPVVEELAYSTHFYLTTNEQHDLSLASKALVNDLKQSHDIKRVVAELSLS